METTVPQIAEEKKKGRFKKIVLFFPLLAHGGFFFSQSLGLPLSMEQLFTLGYALLAADSILLAFFLIRLFRPTKG